LISLRTARHPCRGASRSGQSSRLPAAWRLPALCCSHRMSVRTGSSAPCPCWRSVTAAGRTPLRDRRGDRRDAGWGGFSEFPNAKILFPTLVPFWAGHLVRLRGSPVNRLAQRGQSCTPSRSHSRTGRCSASAPGSRVSAGTSSRTTSRSWSCKPARVGWPRAARVSERANASTRSGSRVDRRWPRCRGSCGTPLVLHGGGPATLTVHHRGGPATLSVHHRTHARLGRERRDGIELLCWRCHRGVHRLRHWPGGAVGRSSGRDAAPRESRMTAAGLARRALVSRRVPPRLPGRGLPRSPRRWLPFTAPKGAPFHQDSRSLSSKWYRGRGRASGGGPDRDRVGDEGRPENRARRRADAGASSPL